MLKLKNAINFSRTINLCTDELLSGLTLHCSIYCIFFFVLQTDNLSDTEFTHNDLFFYKFLYNFFMY